jgi:hypothetical protein
MRIRTLLFVPLASAAIYACSCSAPEPSGPPPGYEDVKLEGLVTTASLTAFVGAFESGPPAEIPSRAPILEWPSDGEKLPRDPPASFCWRFGETTAARAKLPREGSAWTSLDFGPLALITPAPSAPFAAIASPLRDLFGSPRPARAAEPPYTGPATYLVFSTDTDPAFLRIFTSDIAYHPTQEVWEQMIAVRKPISLELVSVYVKSDRVLNGDGPAAGTSMQFSISD